MENCVGRLIAGLALVVAVALGVRAAVHAVGWAPLLLTVAALVLLELGAGVSALLDWREAKLETQGRGRGWLIGHTTLTHRTIRRVRWHATGLRLLVPVRMQERRRQLPAPRDVPVPTATPSAVDDERAAS